MHEGGGRWVGSNKLVELKKKKKKRMNLITQFRAEQKGGSRSRLRLTAFTTAIFRKRN